LNVYESIIWRRLHTNGCYNNVLFVDGDEYDHALSQDKRTLEYLGQGYVICPIYSVSAFHPKIILLTSKTSGKLIISSANITMAAFTQHSELINEFNYDESHEDYLYLFNDCWNYLMAISQDVPLYVREQIEQLFETTPWIQKTGNRVSDYTFIAFPKHQKELPPRIYDLLLSIFGTSSIEELTVLSPFFDSDLRLLKQIREKFNIGITNFIIDPFLSLDPLSRPILSKETNIYRFSNPLDSTKYKSLHAKAIYFKTDKGRYLLCGSMNFTTNAMGIPLKENNYEAGILYKLGSANYYEMLSLADIVQNNNRVKVDDLKFEKRESAETKDRNSILITWAESSYGNINLQLKFAVPSSIKELIMSFFNNAGNPTGNIRIKDHINGSNQIS
jgi:HKD family nuclease